MSPRQGGQDAHQGGQDAYVEGLWVWLIHYGPPYIPPYGPRLLPATLSPPTLIDCCCHIAHRGVKRYNTVYCNTLQTLGPSLCDRVCEKYYKGGQTDATAPSNTKTHEHWRARSP